MSFTVSLLLIVSIVTGVAWWVDRLLGTRMAERDLIWRHVLGFVAAAPLLILAQNHTAFWRWALPSADRSPMQIADRVASSPDVSTSEVLPPTRKATELDAGMMASPYPLAATADVPNPDKASMHSVPAHSSLERSASPRTPAVAFFQLDSLLQIVAVVWVAGLLFSLLRLAVGFHAVRRLLASSTDVVDESLLSETERVRLEIGLTAPVRVAVSSEVSGPVVIGVLRPRVLLPESLLDPLNRADLRIALRHECAHLRRHDLQWNFLLQLVVAAYWFHPLVRVMERAMGQLREDLCDNYVLAGESPVQYAQSLLNLALGGQPVRWSCADLGVFGSARPLEERVEGLLAPERSCGTRPAAGVRFLVTASAMLLTMGAVSVGIADAEGQKPKAPPARKEPARKSGDTGETPAKPTGPARPVVAEAVHGIVQDSNGSPVAQADVYLLGDPEEGYFTLPTHPQKTTTDDNGVFRFKSVSAGSYRIWAESGNRFSNERALGGERVKIEGKGPLDALTLKLMEGCRFRVTVRSLADGTPIQGAAVRFRWPDIERRFDTGEDGTVLIEGVRPAEHVLEARADGFAVEVQRLEKTKPESTTEVEFKVGPGGTIRGTVRDQEGGLAGVGIEARVARQPAELDLGYRKTDKEGRFEIPNVPFGETAKISISRKEFVGQQREVTLSEEKPSQGLAFLMQRRADGGSIAVEVVGPDDRPVADAELVNPGASSNLKRTGRTDAEGRCRLDDVYDSLGRFEVNVKAKGLAPRRVSFEPGSPEKPTPVRVKLEPGHRIRARVQLPDGKPGAKLWVFYNEGEHGNDLGGRVDSDENGRFEVDSLPAGCTFTVYSPKGSAPFHAQQLPLDGEKEVVITLQQAGLVRGRVLDDATGKVLVPYRVRIMVSQNRRPDEPAPSMFSSLVNEGLIITAEEGQFEFGDFPQKAPMQLIVSAEGYEPATVERVLTATADVAKSVDVRLKRIDPKVLRDVTIHLRQANGEPQADAQVRLWTAADRPNDLGQFPSNWNMLTSGQLASMPVCRGFHTGTTDKEGRVNFRNVRTADFAEVAYWGSGISPGRSSIDIQNAKAGKVDVELKAAAPSELIVEIDREAWPKAGQVTVSSGLTTFGYESWIMKAGESRRVFPNLPSGQFSIQLSTPFRSAGASRLESDELARRSVEIKPGESATIRFDAEE